MATMKGMVRVCHRCHAELPGEVLGQASGVSAASDEDHALFCPRCGAPQILLPEYMRTEVATTAAESTTGAVPPPRPQLVEWTVVLKYAVAVAVATAVFAVAGLALPVASFLNTLCILGGSGIVLGLYRSRRPLARIDGRVGLRVGLLTGMAMVVAMGIALAATGVVERFGLHSMAGFDLAVAHLHGQMLEQLNAQGQPPEAERMIRGWLSAPEFQAGLLLFYLAVSAGFVVLLTTIGGGLTGLLQTRRRGLRSGN